ncbi:MAG: AAA family ATPase, partial [Candidatus Poribacteria bacterium]
MERKKLPYGIPNFRSISEEGYIFIDKTPFVEKLENLGEKYIIFLRPRRFGKSLFVSMLEHYYDIGYSGNFERLFGDFHIGRQPTPLRNSYLVLLFDFSGINTETKETTFKGFLDNVKSGLRRFVGNHADLLSEADWSGALEAESPEIAMRNFLDIVNQRTDKRIYLLIDEYDHFANELLAFQFDMFKELISRVGFVRKFYEVLKTGTRDGVIDKMFITGVTPITLDSLTSGFNIGKNLSLDEEFHDMLGFTEDETSSLIEIICSHCNTDLDEIYKQMSDCYNGHRFCEDNHSGGKLFNPNMVLHYLRDYQRYCRPPNRLIDPNIASDYRKIGDLFRLFEMVEGREIINELMEQD